MKKNDDLQKRTDQALQRQAFLQPVPKRLQLPAPEQSKSATLVARTRAALDAATVKSIPPPASRTERVKLLMTCSDRGVSYIRNAERRGNELRFVDGYEMSGPDGAARLPARLSGQYRIDANGLACPVCGNAGSVWLCDCSQMNGAMHCCGNKNGQYRCACGRCEQREFERIDTTEVRGVSVAATPGRSGTKGGQSRLKQVSHEHDR